MNTAKFLASIEHDECSSPQLMNNARTIHEMGIESDGNSDYGDVINNR